MRLLELGQGEVSESKKTSEKFIYISSVTAFWAWAKSFVREIYVCCGQSAGRIKGQYTYINQDAGNIFLENIKPIIRETWQT
jgi:hypothetical protein